MPRTLVALLFLATLLNYADRLALGTTQRYWLPEFEPDPARHNAVYADVQSAFGLSFGLMQLAAGFLADRLSLRYVYAAALLVWSAAGLATGFVPAGSLGVLIACRVLLGAGEAFNWPCAVACVQRTVPRESRSLANGLFHSGASLGALLTPFLVLALVTSEPGAGFGSGWRTVFVVVGLAGVAWAIAWLALTRGPLGSRLGRAPELVPGPAESIRNVFASRQFAICFASVVCVNIAWHFYNTWLPRYLTEDLRLGPRIEQYALAAFYLAADLGSVGAGWLGRELVRRGATVERTRQRVMTLLATLTVILTAAAVAAEPPGLKLAMFCGVAAAIMGGYSVAFSLVQDVSPRHTAQVLGVAGCGSWLAVSLITQLVGGLAGQGKYNMLFLAVGCVPAAAAAAGWFWPRPAPKPPEVSP